jgi:hypothetical protein
MKGRVEQARDVISKIYAHANAKQIDFKVCFSSKSPSPQLMGGYR